MIHPIIPSQELVEAILKRLKDNPCKEVTTAELITQVITEAAQWGADQELEACCALMDDWGLDGEDLMQCRRPKPQTLNSIAMQMLGTIERDGHYIPEITDTIRRALEALPDG
jgi:hypothetical protein